MPAKFIFCVLALAVFSAATTAKLSQYESILAPAGVMANSVKMAEPRVQQVPGDPALQSIDDRANPSGPLPVNRIADGAALREAFESNDPPVLHPLRT